jgi:hypothetical protein
VVRLSLFFKWEAPTFDRVLPESEPIGVVSSRWLWAARVFALIYAISLAGEYVAAAHFDSLNPLVGFLSTFGLRSLLSLFGVASNALFWPLGRSFNLSLALIIFGPITPPFVDMMHQPNQQLATQGLLLFWSFGICSAVLGLSSVVAFRKVAHEAKGKGGLRFAFRAGICCPLVVWLIFMLLIFIWLAAGGGIHI